MRGKQSRLERLNELMRPYGLQCYTWSPGDGVTRYRFSRELDSDYFACRAVVTVLGYGQADLVATTWAQAWEAGREAGMLEALVHLKNKKED